ncbi:uncharacterized protein LOC121386647 [Gigantopelta aegis]|uniref:uncharacterized protein LOC121386647 n=1 Tax=Gigantopelta aegis TaxID=1735272 RepID=UPI001B888A0E|nr:uncharacterized protein LOC121386647 [Gigantopelta aegis]
MAFIWKSLFWWNLVTVIFLLNTDVCLGIAHTVIDCMNGGRPGESLTLTCKITGTIVSGIRWLRHNGGSSEVVILCNTANTICDPSGGKTGYTGTIVSPTQHDLTIHSFSNEVDVGEWICRDGPFGAGPFSCNMTLYTPPDPNPESQVSESTIIILLVVIGVLLVVTVAVSWLCYKRTKREPKSEQEKAEQITQEGVDERGQVDKPAVEQID